MKKYCGKCGAKLNKKRLCPNCDKQAISKSKQKLKKYSIRFLITFLVLVILFTGITSTLVYFGIIDFPIISDVMEKTGLIDNKNNQEDDSTSNFVCLDGSFSDVSIEDETSALNAIDDAKDLLGIQDVQDELNNCQTENILENNYYRFYQEYDDIPVYGRTVTISANSQGDCLMLSGNYLNLGDLDTSVDFSKDDAFNSMKEQFGSETFITSEGLVIYSLDKQEPEIAWKINVINEDVNEQCFVSAKSGDILAELSMAYGEDVSGNGLDIDGQNQNFTTEQIDGSYRMRDNQKDIRVFNANNSTLVPEIVIVDENNKIYTSKDNKYYDEDNNEVTITGDNFSFEIKDKDNKVVASKGEYAVRLTTKNIFTTVTEVTSNSTTWDNPKAVTLMSRVSTNYDFWKENYNRVSFNGKNGVVLAVYDDFLGVNWLVGDTTNAYSWGASQLPLTVLTFGSDNTLDYDVISHEYTHSVERCISNLNYLGESGALMEAYSDIFGEIVEDWADDRLFNGTCDWINPYRDIVDPNSNDDPDSYLGKYWVDVVDTNNDKGGVHTNNTVISHAAYLMSIGIEDNSQIYSSLSTKDIADLFYSAMPHMSSNCTFQQFKQIIINCALQMYEQENLSNKQVLTVKEAFNQVGLSSETTTYTVTENFDLCVYDIDNELYDNYSLKIEEVDITNLPQGPSAKPNTKEVDTVTISDDKPYSLSLEPGIYYFTITDLTDDSQTQRFYVTVSSSGSDTINVITQFKKVTDDKKHTDTTNIPENAVEFNGHYYYLYELDDIDNGQEASVYCKNQGGYLATITSAQENEFLYNYLTGQDFESAYFGLSDYNQEGKWEWLNGEEVSYTNWHPGEPNSENKNEDYAMFYYKYSDGTWNDGDFGHQTVNSNAAFICEWGDYEGTSQDSTNVNEREIVLVLDTSNSMTGSPLRETKKAANKFIETVLKEDAGIGLVTYNSNANIISDFSVDYDNLEENVDSLDCNGNTNIGDGLEQAYDMLENSNAKTKIIVLMSDGVPNVGKEGNALISYADQIKDSDILIYTLGFFEKMDDKSEAQELMEGIASEGCHYEVADSDDLVFFFDDVADQINGQRYIYIRIACPVDVTVSYNGETLSSKESDLNTRTKFGVLSFEDNGTANQTKILRLKEEQAYDIKINGTDQGTMNYTIGFMDEEGNYSDFREFENIEITNQTVIDTKAEASETTVINVDEDGDGNYDLRYQAAANESGSIVENNSWLDLIFILTIVVFLGGIICYWYFKKHKK